MGLGEERKHEMMGPGWLQGARHEDFYSFHIKYKLRK